MNLKELTTVVARIQSGDNRTVDRVTMAHWQEIIGDLNYQDALTAVVTHFCESTAYLMPAHIINNVKRIREQRAMANGYELEDVKDPAPRPFNEDAMIAASNNPAEFSHQCAIYNRQLLDAGYPTDDRYPIAPASEAA